jgi:hypothetical protein
MASEREDDDYFCNSDLIMLLESFEKDIELQSYTEAIVEDVSTFS